MIHVYPTEDWIEHDLTTSDGICNCICEPRIIWADEETGKPFNQPVVVHNAIDGRE